MLQIVYQINAYSEAGILKYNDYYNYRNHVISASFFLQCKERIMCLQNCEIMKNSISVNDRWGVHFIRSQKGIMGRVQQPSLSLSGSFEKIV